MHRRIMHSLVLLLFISFLFITTTAAQTETVDLNDYTIDFEYDETDAEAGETFRIEATVTNTAGETRTDIELELQYDDPFSRNGDDEKEIGTLLNGESRTVSFRVDIDDDAQEDDYDIEFEIRDNKDDDTDEFPIEVTSHKAELIIGTITSLPTTITPDTQDIKLTITVENVGEEDADSVRLRLILPEGIAASGSFTDIANLGTIESGDGKALDFYIDTEAYLASGVHRATLDFTYESGTSTVRDTESFDMRVKGRPQFTITQTQVQPRPIPIGSTGELHITLQNTGEDKAEETSIRIFENAQTPLTFNEKTSYIGNLEIGQQGTAQFSFDVDSDARPNNYLVSIQVRTVFEDTVSVEEYTVTIPVSEKEPLQIGIIVLLILIVTIILLPLIAWRAIRRR